MEALVLVVVAVIAYIGYLMFKSYNDRLYAPGIDYKQVIEQNIGQMFSMLRPFCETYPIIPKEIIPFAYIVGKISVEVTGGDMEKYNDAFEKELEFSVTNDPMGFENRFQTYVAVANGMPYRAEWSLTDIPTSTKNDGVLRCAIVLADFITNPECVKDYSNAPFQVQSIFKDAKFFEFYITKFMPKVQKYSYEIAGKQFKAIVNSYAKQF